MIITHNQKNAINKKEIVYENLKNRIVNNVLKPHEQLNERALAEEMNISKTPIREALQQLERNGFVEIIPNQGWLVSGIYIQDIREVFQVRQIFECAAASIAATQSDIIPFQELEAKGTEEEKSPKKLLISGKKIHTAIIKTVNNNRLINMYNTIIDQVVRIQIYFVNQFDQKRLEQAEAEHLGILRAIIRHDPKGAESAMMTHLKNAMEDIKKRM